MPVHGVPCSINTALCNPAAVCGVWAAERVGLRGGQARLSRGPACASEGILGQQHPSPPCEPSGTRPRARQGSG